VIAHNTTFEGKVKAVYVPTEQTIGIDTMLDFHITESLLNLREQKR
jgi:CMP-N-acetylneuraminic acid synthetase